MTTSQPKDLADLVTALRTFVPAMDFQTSKRFYADLGFRVEPLGDQLAALHLGRHSFLLQNFYVEQWARNFMMHMLVDDIDRWWRHIAGLDLPKRYDVQGPRPPKAEDWGLTVAYVFDPSGLLWHIAQRTPIAHA